MTYKVICKAHIVHKGAKTLADCKVVHSKTYDIDAVSKRQAESIAWDWYSDTLSDMRLSYDQISTQVIK